MPLFNHSTQLLPQPISDPELAGLVCRSRRCPHQLASVRAKDGKDIGTFVIGDASDRSGFQRVSGGFNIERKQIEVRAARAL